jgi:hypothetical protein
LRANDFTALERPLTSGFGRKLPFLAELGQSSVHGVAEARAGVASAICELLKVVGEWMSGACARVQLAACSR